MLRLRYVIQRCARASVTADGILRGEIQAGLVVLFGVGQGQETLEPMPLPEVQQRAVQLMKPILERCTAKILGLRVFPDAQGRMNLSVGDIDGGIALVSQFTLFADCRNGFRPSFGKAAPPSIAQEIYKIQEQLLIKKFSHLVTGVFGSHMHISLLNDGPVTIVLDADENGFL